MSRNRIQGVVGLSPPRKKTIREKYNLAAPDQSGVNTPRYSREGSALSQYADGFWKHRHPSDDEFSTISPALAKSLRLKVQQKREKLHELETERSYAAESPRYAESPVSREPTPIPRLKLNNNELSTDLDREDSIVSFQREISRRNTPQPHEQPHEDPHRSRFIRSYRKQAPDQTTDSDEYFKPESSRRQSRSSPPPMRRQSRSSPPRSPDIPKQREKPKKRKAPSRARSPIYISEPRPISRARTPDRTHNSKHPPVQILGRRSRTPTPTDRHDKPRMEPPVRDRRPSTPRNRPSTSQNLAPDDARYIRRPSHQIPEPLRKLSNISRKMSDPSARWLHSRPSIDVIRSTRPSIDIRPRRSILVPSPVPEQAIPEPAVAAPPAAPTQQQTFLDQIPIGNLLPVIDNRGQSLLPRQQQQPYAVVIIPQTDQHLHNLLKPPVKPQQRRTKHHSLSDDEENDEDRYERIPRYRTGKYHDLRYRDKQWRSDDDDDDDDESPVEEEVYIKPKIHRPKRRNKKKPAVAAQSKTDQAIQTEPLKKHRNIANTDDIYRNDDSDLFTDNGFIKDVDKEYFVRSFEPYSYDLNHIEDIEIGYNTFKETLTRKRRLTGWNGDYTLNSGNKPVVLNPTSIAKQSNKLLTSPPDDLYWDELERYPPPTRFKTLLTNPSATAADDDGLQQQHADSSNQSYHNFKHRLQELLLLDQYRREIERMNPYRNIRLKRNNNNHHNNNNDLDDLDYSPHGLPSRKYLDSLSAKKQLKKLSKKQREFRRDNYGFDSTDESPIPRTEYVLRGKKYGTTKRGTTPARARNGYHSDHYPYRRVDEDEFRSVSRNDVTSHVSEPHKTDKQHGINIYTYGPVRINGSASPPPAAAAAAAAAAAVPVETEEPLNTDQLQPPITGQYVNTSTSPQHPVKYVQHGPFLSAVSGRRSNPREDHTRITPVLPEINKQKSMVNTQPLKPNTESREVQTQSPDKDIGVQTETQDEPFKNIETQTETSAAAPATRRTESPTTRRTQSTVQRGKTTIPSRNLLKPDQNESRRKSQPAPAVSSLRAPLQTRSKSKLKKSALSAINRSKDSNIDNEENESDVESIVFNFNEEADLNPKSATPDQIYNSRSSSYSQSDSENKDKGSEKENKFVKKRAKKIWKNFEPENVRKMNESFDDFEDLIFERDEEAVYILSLLTDDGDIIGPIKLEIDDVQIGFGNGLIKREKRLRNRVSAATDANDYSSRSHTMLQLMIDSEIQDPEDENLYVTKHGKLTFVDLAGSEKVKDTQNGEAVAETNNINKSLLVLGNCISALADSKKKHGHIPYRDSKLTKLLADSLGGNGVTLMISCVSPSTYNVGETMNTLRYSNRAKKIKNKPVIKMDPREKLILTLKRELKILRSENHYLRQQLNFPEKPKGRLQKENDEQFHKLIKPVPATSNSKNKKKKNIEGSQSNEFPVTDNNSTSGILQPSASEPSASNVESPSKSPPQSSATKQEQSSLYDMLQEYMVENETLRKENTELVNFKNRSRRDQEQLAHDNERLSRRLEDIERLLSISGSGSVDQNLRNARTSNGNISLPDYHRSNPLNGYDSNTPPGGYSSRRQANMKPPHRLPPDNVNTPPRPGYGSPGYADRFQQRMDVRASQDNIYNSRPPSPPRGGGPGYGSPGDGLNPAFRPHQSYPSLPASSQHIPADQQQSVYPPAYHQQYRNNGQYDDPDPLPSPRRKPGPAPDPIPQNRPRQSQNKQNDYPHPRNEVLQQPETNGRSNNHRQHYRQQ
ncbi:uncharacterized protein LOC141899193 [Tubulanus polymorphus]|uniref:uncharacterized protein LOC141899193 n=1 Tax=Tubulanus polymorphus TaxID=672921 RepID=UPI003DA47519